MILKLVQDKNPLDKEGNSPLRFAKYNGQEFADAYLKLLDNWPSRNLPGHLPEVTITKIVK